MAVEKAQLEPEIGAVVKLLIEASGGDYTAVADLLGISRVALSGRLSGHRKFKPAELSLIARHFDVSPAVFFTAPMDLFRQSRNLGYKETAGQRADLSLVHGSGKGNPVRQSPLMLGYASAAAPGE